ncbi:hypothetical protein JW868_03440 [Candidatus Woesearchaeota archaeon]|nr:hypothetical protein [Candidatus Woesearchaeota archaeon]
MNVNVFKKGDDLIVSIKEADVVVDCLALNDSTKGLLNRDFFQSFKKGSFFITITSTQIYNLDALKEALNQGIIAGAASDAGSAQSGNVRDPKYLTILDHPKILATPHIAYNSDVTKRVCYDMMIDNIEEWLKGKPINLVG